MYALDLGHLHLADPHRIAGIGMTYPQGHEANAKLGDGRVDEAVASHRAVGRAVIAPVSPRASACNRADRGAGKRSGSRVISIGDVGSSARPVTRPAVRSSSVSRGSLIGTPDWCAPAPLVATAAGEARG